MNKNKRDISRGYQIIYLFFREFSIGAVKQEPKPFNQFSQYPKPGMGPPPSHLPPPGHGPGTEYQPFSFNCLLVNFVCFGIACVSKSSLDLDNLPHPHFLNLDFSPLPFFCFFSIDLISLGR